MKKMFILLIALALSGSWQAQSSAPTVKKPKLIVGIVVDQMRNDYIYRYWSRFGNSGFKRLVNEGFYFKNAHFNYIPTYTGPGHSSIYTGATPRAHGIIGNDWYVRAAKKETYCTYDSASKSVGGSNKAGCMSPIHQLSSTVGDEMKMSSNGRAKVFAVALKDRSAILPAGHAADAAFWFDEGSGNFISSSYYLKDLPQWLKDFNARQLTRKYLEQGWSTLAYPEGYTASIADDNNYESVPSKKERPTLPYSYKTFLDKNQLGIIRATPFGNSITKDLALECLVKEELGKDEICDLFSISFSSTDIIAHSYGPRAVEVEDTYLRLDKDIAEILTALDKQVGVDNYAVFLTADHGGADVPNHLKDKKIPAGYLSGEQVLAALKAYFKNNYGDSALVSAVSNEQVFMNERKLQELKLNADEVEARLCKFLVSIPGVAEAYPSSVLKYGSFEKMDYRTLLQNGYNHKLSGNVAFIFEPAWMDYAEKGTTHGAGYNYDTHVPVIFYGFGVKKGSSFDYTTITQIAPSVCELIQVNQPNACTSAPLNGYFR